LIDACKAANNDADVRAIEKECDAVTDEFEEPWDPRRGTESGD
jgi:hypothetical protein